MNQIVSKTDKIPLCVDLDGTLIFEDVFLQSLRKYLRSAPHHLFQVLFWLCRGRAFLKHRLAEKVPFSALTLTWNQPVLTWLNEQKANGHSLYLVTAAPAPYANPISQMLKPLFEEVFTSTPTHNLRGRNKARFLEKKFGLQGFDYVGNDWPDLKVWHKARRAIITNAPERLIKRAKEELHNPLILKQ